MPSILARMAEATDDLSKRYYSSYSCGYGSYYDYNSGGCYYSAWSAYGRWILLAVIIVLAFIVFLAFSCITARRRRKRGQQPIAGTGWLAPAPAGHGQAQYTGAQNQGYNSGNTQSYPMSNQQYAAPTYAPPAAAATGGHHGANESYYGGQEGGVTAPSNVYQPPSGPPPAKY